MIENSKAISSESDDESVDFYVDYLDYVKYSSDLDVYKKFVSDMSLKSPCEDIDIAINKIIPHAMYRFSQLDKFLIDSLGNLRSYFCKHNDLILRSIRDTRFTDSQEMFDISCMLMRHGSCSDFHDETCDGEKEEYKCCDGYENNGPAAAIRIYGEYSVISMQKYCQFYSSVVYAVFHDDIYDNIFYHWRWNEDYRIKYHAMMLYIAENADDVIMAEIDKMSYEFYEFIHTYVYTEDDEAEIHDDVVVEIPKDIDQVVEIFGLLLLNGMKAYDTIWYEHIHSNTVSMSSMYDVLSSCRIDRIRDLVKDFRLPWQ